jgi:hypothetical protein
MFIRFFVNECCAGLKSKKSARQQPVSRVVFPRIAVVFPAAAFQQAGSATRITTPPGEYYLFILPVGAFTKRNPGAKCLFFIP